MKTRLVLFLASILCASAALAGGPPGSAPRPVDPSAPGYSWPAVDYDADGVYDRLDRCPGTPPGTEVDQCGCPLAEASVSALRAAALYPPGVVLSVPDERLRHGVIRLDMAFFRTDRAKLRPGARAALGEVARLLRAYPTLRFEVSGHADSRGTEAHNRDLSLRRAREVRRFLIEQGGVRDIQLVARGYGEARLATEERDGTELQANRRVELRLLNPEAMPRGSKLEPRAPMEALASQSARARGGPLLASR